MKGPHERLKYDLRRLWECPICKRRERTPGSVTFRHCSCRMKQLDGKPVVMQLIDDDVQRLAPAVTIQHRPEDPAPQEVARDQQEVVQDQIAAITAVPPPDTSAGP